MLSLHPLWNQRIKQRLVYFNSDIFPIFAQALPQSLHKYLLEIITEDEIKEDQSRGYQYYFLQDNDNVIGIAYRKHKAPDTIYLNGFYILPQYQRQWYGTRFLDLIEEKLQKEWIKYFYGETNTYYDRAVAFYRAYGYEIIENNKELEKHYLHQQYKTLAPNTIFFYKKLW